MTRDEVLDVLERVVSLKGKRLKREEVPVLFLQDRIAVLLPSDRFTPDQHIKLDGKFQLLMTQRMRAHGYLDFVNDWRGLDSHMSQGFT